MGEERNSSKGPSGMGPGISGASGDFIEGTGGNAGIGATGERDDEAASGARPDERQAPGPQQLGNASREGGNVTRPSGSQSGTIGGGGPYTAPSDEGDPGRPGGGEIQDTPGGNRNVGPANDREESGKKAHGK